MSVNKLEIKSKHITLMKSITAAQYEEKTVLTNSVWEYVDLWLRRQSSDRAREASFFWQQAHNFYSASEELPIESRPLTAYYCCLNAAKALLAINAPRNINFNNIRHGVCSHISTWNSRNIRDAKVTFVNSGVLNELSKYFAEESAQTDYTVYELLYNIPCIHRAFSITYPLPELFIPIEDVGFYYDSQYKEGWVQFKVEERFGKNNALHFAPSDYERVETGLGETASSCLIRCRKHFDWDKHICMAQRLKALSDYHGCVRKDLMYIYGDSRLWYLKKDMPNNQFIVKRNSITLIFAVLHWLSELVRYNPQKFSKLLNSKQNWLIREFVDNALPHFIDEISCEITRIDIMTNGYRK